MKYMSIAVVTLAAIGLGCQSGGKKMSAPMQGPEQATQHGSPATQPAVGPVTAQPAKESSSIIEESKPVTPVMKSATAEKPMANATRPTAPVTKNDSEKPANPAPAETPKKPVAAVPAPTTQRSNASSNAVKLPSPATRAMTTVAVSVLKPSKVASTQPATKGITGNVTFTKLDDNKVKVVADITGLEPNSKHGFHIHEKGDLSAPDLKSAGDHFNPGKHKHGAPGEASHAGDLGNVQADESGTAHLELTLSGLSMGTGQPNDILGKSIILHGGVDDLTGQPSGNSGPRIAGGVISATKK